jgi:putative FmdB family regulatory protein
MPIFEFVCGKCGEEFERLVFSSGLGDVKCPKCDSDDVTKILSVFSSSPIERSLGSSCSHGASGGHS